MKTRYSEKIQLLFGFGLVFREVNKKRASFVAEGERQAKVTF